MVAVGLFQLLDDDGGQVSRAAISGDAAHPADYSAAGRSGDHQDHGADHRPLHDARSDVSFDLAAIQDPVHELVALDGMVQIHHGIYKVQSKLMHGGTIQFAFKTECRRASKWHGQQGWSEVATYHLTRSFNEQRDTPQFATAPAARGVFVKISQEQLERVVHRDRCGVVPDDFAQHIPSDRRAEIGANGGQKAHILLVGVALTWQPSHNDNALPGNAIVPLFSADGPPLSKRQREMVSQISDVQAMDYLLINDDREEKNWFKDESGRFVMMDNGWAFAGRGYEGSICGAELELVKCPPLFRHVTGNKRCGAGTSPKSILNCRFRPETAQSLFDIVGVLDGAVPASSEFSQPSFKPSLVVKAFESRTLSDWQSAVVLDPLIQFLDRAYARQQVQQKHRPFSVALERYIHGCPPSSMIPAESKRVVNSHLADGGNSSMLLTWLRYGIAVRMAELTQHIAECCATHGEAYVFGAALTPQPAEQH
jgi:hypothetical protein